MANPKNNEVGLEDVKKAIDRLALIELCKAGATTQQIRDVVGPVDNNLVSKIRKATKKTPGEE